jgi:hypothetical protein
VAAALPSLAAAITQALNEAGGWSVTFTAERLWQPIFDIKDTSEEVKVSVVGTKIESARIARGQWEQIYTVEIGIQHRPDGLATLDLDSLALLVEEIATYWEDNKEITAGAKRYICVGVATDYVNFEHLDEQRQFTSVVVLNFKGWR